MFSLSKSAWHLINTHVSVKCMILEYRNPSLESVMSGRGGGIAFFFGMGEGEN